MYVAMSVPALVSVLVSILVMLIPTQVDVVMLLILVSSPYVEPPTQ